MKKSNNIKKVILTGASGFIGRHLVPLLLEKNYSVIAISRDKNKAKNYDWFKEVEYIELDINKNRNNLKIEKNTSLIHLAWSNLPNYNSNFHFEENLTSSYKFIRSLVDQNIEQVLVTGTCFEYGLQNGPLNSSLTCNPITAYGFAKDCLRKQLNFLLKDKNLCFQWARLFYIYGEGQNKNSLFSQLDFAIKENEKFFNMSKGEQLRDYLPVEKVAQKIMHLFINKKKGLHNICSGEPISIRNMVEARISYLGSNIKPNYGHYAYPDYEPMAFWGVKDVDDKI